MTRRKPDVLTLVIGLILAGIALLVLVNLVGGALLAVSRLAAPVMLVTVGVIGIAVSQYRSRPRRPVDPRTVRQPAEPNPKEQP